MTLASGSLDVTAFMRLGGVFASVMTSNLVFVGIAAVKTEVSLAKHCAVALVSHPEGWGQMVLLGALAVAMGAQGVAAHQIGGTDVATTHLTGSLTNVVGSLTGRRRPDPVGTVALVALLVGAAAGAALIEEALEPTFNTRSLGSRPLRPRALQVVRRVFWCSSCHMCQRLPVL